MGNLVLTAASSNPVLVPPANILFGGSGSSRTVTGNDVLLRGHVANSRSGYSWHSESNRWPNDSLLNSISDFEVLYAPAEDTNTEGEF